MKPALGLQDPWALDVFRVVQKVQESADVFSLELEADQDSRFLPGQFNMLYAFGKGEVPISISGSSSPNRLWHTIRQVGKITASLCAASPGELIYLRGPYGHAWPMPDAEGRDIVIVAGGIGLAPVRPVIQEILRSRSQYGRVSVLYGARTPDELIYRKEIGDWADSGGIDVKVTVDLASGDWHGSVGVVTKLFDQVVFRPPEALVMTCGPEVMMRFVAEGMMERGVAPEHIFVSMERNMKCAIGFCGHCMYGPNFICRDGPVFSYARVCELLTIREL